MMLGVLSVSFQSVLDFPVYFKNLQTKKKKTALFNIAKKWKKEIENFEQKSFVKTKSPTKPIEQNIGAYVRPVHRINQT